MRDFELITEKLKKNKRKVREKVEEFPFFPSGSKWEKVEEFPFFPSGSKWKKSKNFPSFPLFLPINKPYILYI
jgi:hypothetical protein